MEMRSDEKERDVLGSRYDLFPSQLRSISSLEEGISAISSFARSLKTSSGEKFSSVSSPICSPCVTGLDTSRFFLVGELNFPYLRPEQQHSQLIR